MTAVGEDNLDQPQHKHDPMGVDYDVQDTITSIGSIVTSVGSVGLNLGKKPPPKRNRVCPDGGHLVSILYTVIICILGIVLPVREALQEKWLTTYVEALFLAYLYGMSLVFILFVEIYLLQMTRKHGHERKKNQEKPQILVKDKITDAQSVYDTVNGKGYSPVDSQSYRIRFSGLNNLLLLFAAFSQEFTAVNNAALRRRQSMIEPTSGVEIYILEPQSEWDEPLPHHTSLYVRFGSIIFGLGNMVYDGLLLKKIQSNNEQESGCLDASFIWPHYVHLAFLLCQTYFIFKHPQVKITIAKPLARMGFMHIFATNVCVWIRTVIRETLESFLHHSADGHSMEHHEAADHNTTHYTNVTVSNPCEFDDDILTKASPYLFPCVLEYSLLAAAVMFSMYADVGTHSKSSETSENGENGENSGKDLETQNHSFITEINFHRSHKGLFAGVMVIAATCVSIVLFYSYLDQQDNAIYPLIYHATMIGLYSLVLCATLIAIIQLHVLKFNRNLTTSVDDVMLVVAMGGLVLYLVLKLLPLIGHMMTASYTVAQTLQLTETWLALVAAMIHTWFLIDGSRRMTSTEKQYFTKPGRGAVMFLLLTNVALWLFRTFHMKEVEIEGHLQENEYGYLAWQLIMHALVPLLIFYHFHSSACLAHIWSGAYVPAQQQDKKPKLNHATSTADPNILENGHCKAVQISPSQSPKLSPQTPAPRHVASEDLVPDRIIEFVRHGKAPHARNPSEKTIVECIESPVDTGRSITWPRMNGDVANTTMLNGKPPAMDVTVVVTEDSLGDSNPSVTWIKQESDEESHDKVVKWQLEPHCDEEESV